MVVEGLGGPKRWMNDGLQQALFGITRLDQQYPVVTMHKFGAGTAIYVILYLNLDGLAKHVTLKGRAYSILRDQEYEDGFILGPFEPEFLALA